MAKKKTSAPRQTTPGGGEEIDFENALGEIEEIVSMLESGDLGLTESLVHYERGINRLKQCHQLLEAAEQRVSLLSGFDADGNPVTEAMDEIEIRTGGGREKTNRARRRGPESAKGSVEGGSDALSDESQSGRSVDDISGLF